MYFRETPHDGHKRQRTVRRLMACSAWLVVGIAVPASAQAPVPTPTTDFPNLKVCTDAAGRLQMDPAHIESRAFLDPPYNRYNTSNYDLWLYACASDNPQSCTNLSSYT